MRIFTCLKHDLIQYKLNPYTIDVIPHNVYRQVRDGERVDKSLKNVTPNYGQLLVLMS